MRRLGYCLVILSLFAIVGVYRYSCLAAPPLFQMGKSAKIEADPKKDYLLKESDGNWFVMAKKFSGDNAALDAKRLVYELRASYKLSAFVFKYDPDKMEEDAVSAKMGKKFRYQTVRPVEYAVLIGGYPTAEDLDLQKTLEKIRKSQPRSLKNDEKGQAAADNFKELAKNDSKYAGYGPLGGASPVPNPLLPADFFNSRGVVDPFLAKLNSDSKYSLLNNPKTYTVRVATFSGDSSMKKSSEAFGDLETRLQYAGLRAAALCEALRNQGVEAWEFHDRDCSFVTIGSFDKYGTLQPDGHTELNPQVAQIMKKYGGELVEDGEGLGKYRAYTIVVEIPDPSSSSLAPKKKKLQIACDLRPVIIVVPQRSGEESVKKIALAKEEMEKAKKQIVEHAVERSLEAAENDLESVKQFANANGRAMTEEEYLVWAKAQQKAQGAQVQGKTQAQNQASVAQNRAVSSTPKTPQNAAVSERYAQKAPVQAAPNGAVATTNRTTPNAARTNNATTAQNGNANRSATRAYGTTPTKTAQKKAAPTY